MIPQNVIEQVQDIDIIRIIQDEGFEPKRSGNGRWVICCPFHNEKTPSLSIDAAKNLWHCFGCGEGGNAISFVQKIHGFNFPETIAYLAKRHGIIYEEHEPTPEEREAQFHLESLKAITREALSYFVSHVTDKPAVEYLAKRGWDINTDAGKETIALFQIGYAPNKSDGLMEYLRAKGWSDLKLMEEAGLIGRNQDTLKPYDFFRDRIIFPIFNENGEPVAFSGRQIGDKGVKYINTKETKLYSKSNTLFGWPQAYRSIASERRVVLVEGNPDVVRLHEIGVTQAIAPLGTALTDKQIERIIKRGVQSVVIIGDRDVAKAGPSKGLPGEEAAIKHGYALTKMGLNVQIMELPQPDSTKKVDADSYFQINRDKRCYDELIANSTRDFISWIAERKILASSSEKERADAIVEICQLVSFVKDENAAEIYVDTFARKYKNGQIWKREYHKSKGERERETKIADGSQKMLSEYGFYVADNCYCSAGATGSERRWSNFTMKPILHIRDEKNARRIYELQNNKGQTVVVKFNQSELVSFTDFKTRIETAGNFIWEAGQGELTTLKKYLYDDTPSADEIKQLGWQKQWGFYAWGNGGFDEMNNFVKADKYGIIEIGGRKFYLPGCSLDTANNTNGYQQQRKFVFMETNDVTLASFATRLIEVFGNNAKVGLCFLLAALFKDEVTKITTSFPILNLFGPKGTGKSELGHALTSFFIPNNIAPNINNTTKAALAEAVAEYSDALVHLDEYKNNLDLEKREFLKGLWDGAGRSRMNMDDKKTRETTAVDCGVIMSGQEMPTADIALFNRLIFLTFSKAEFSDQEKRNFESLQTIEKRGLTHLTRQILSLRPRFRSGFREAWDATCEDMNNKVRTYGIEDRTLRNWATALSAYRCLESYLDLPFCYNDMLDICCKGCIEQNNKTKQNNELSGFWEIFDILVSSCKCWINVDFKIKVGGKPQKFRNCTEKYEYVQNKRYLFLNFARPSQLYAKEVRESAAKGIPRETLKYYLENSREYLGTVQSERFTVIDSATGFVSGDRKSKPYQAMVFDYDAIEENYNISLEVSSEPFEEGDNPKPAGNLPEQYNVGELPYEYSDEQEDL